MSTEVALAAVKAAALSGLLTVAVVTATTGAPYGGASESVPEDPAQQEVARAVAGHHCSYTGFETGVTPESALIRTQGGRLRQVSFEVGWDVYNGHRPGTLIAVCLDQPAALVDHALDR